ncbi:hypothetical protein [Dyella sp.]|uniref:hypothetical protein n=1 Tax=Dyella sp. TaxID=1869338 RepID=UPI003F81A841
MGALTQSGHLTNVADPYDGRAKRVLLTRRGIKAMATLIALSATFEQRLAERLVRLARRAPRPLPLSPC